MEDEAEGRLGGGGEEWPTTESVEVEDAPVRRARTVRRVFVAALCAFLLLGLLGVLGVRSGRVTASGGGYELEVVYPRVARPGLAVPWTVTVRRPGGFDGPVTLATTSEYLDVFDSANLDPEPESATRDGQRALWEFTPPRDGDTLEVSLDTRVGPHVQWGKSAVTAVLRDDAPVVQVRYRTYVLP